jgi:hypothetical protein
MNNRFALVMMMLAFLNVLIFSAQAIWDQETVKPWILPGIWVFIAATFALDYFGRKRKV